MDGRGRALDNDFCERLWRSVESEDINLNQCDTVRQTQAGLSSYFDFYNYERPHQSLNCRTPAEEHFVLCAEPAAFAQVRLVIPFRGPKIGARHNSANAIGLIEIDFIHGVAVR